MNRTIAVFDLDGTLTRRDTLLPFLVRACGPARVAGALAVAAPLFARAAVQGGTHRDAAKAAVLSPLLAGERLERLVALAERYADDVVATQLRPETRQRLEWHRGEGHELVIVSASPELYVSAIGRRLGVDAVLGTRLEIDPDGRLTGRLVGRNCRGPEKTARLAEWFGEAEPQVAFAYGDSTGDRELLELAETAVLVRRRRPGGRSKRQM